MKSSDQSNGLNVLEDYGATISINESIYIKVCFRNFGSRSFTKYEGSILSIFEVSILELMKVLNVKPSSLNIMKD
jgi:hypothetical protein